MLRRFAVCALIAATLMAVIPTRSPAASKEIMELQRDVAGLQEQLRVLKESQDKQLAALTVLVQQALDSSKSSTTGVAVIQNNLQQSLRDMEAKVSAPVAGLSARLDGMDQDMRTLQQSVSDLNGSMNKLQQQLADLKNAVAVLATPAPAPPGSTPGGGATGPGGTAVPGISGGAAAQQPCPAASDLYPQANADKSAGKWDIALSEFAEYLRCYGNLPLAPAAQYNIGAIHVQQGDYESAVQDFDAVLEKYPENSKTEDAMYSKGSALVKLGRRTDGGDEFAQLIRHYPGTELAVKACDERKKMGLNCAAPRGATRKR
ncbi:MAG TPA: tetratricopeptide repeat protein [Bryobacteraceae bacterium]|nr:tetratricopeptide repeat protein [Bryobacteraceae bacterium]